VPELIAQRARERGAALAALGCRNAPVVRVGMPDGIVPQQALQQRLTELLRPSDVAVSPWRFDGHPDHEAVADAVGAATAAVGAVHVEAPIWGWHWASPDKEQMPWRRAVVLGLDARTAERKRLATRCYVSQLTDDPSTGAEPILPEWALDRLVHDREVFFR
jgi:LmbE family N-acetylglucosaminyl deacetylase